MRKIGPSSLGLESEQARDIGVLAGVAAVMMSFKLVKILPGVALFSGAKAMFFFPLYILAAARTKSRWGGTVAGAIMGIIAFLNGDGRYGIFEVAKHIVPGLFVDLTWPSVRSLRGSVVALCVFGLFLAVARTSTEFLMVLALSADSAELYLFPALKLVPNLLAGVLSGFISYGVLKKFCDVIDRDVSREHAVSEFKKVEGL